MKCTIHIRMNAPGNSGRREHKICICTPWTNGNTLGNCLETICIGRSFRIFRHMKQSLHPSLFGAVLDSPGPIRINALTPVESKGKNFVTFRRKCSIQEQYSDLSVGCETLCKGLNIGCLQLNLVTSNEAASSCCPTLCLQDHEKSSSPVGQAVFL